MIDLQRDTGAYLAQFAQLDRERPAPDWLAPLRQAAIARFAELGFPSTREEEWRLTNVEPIARTRFRPAPAPRPEEALLARAGELAGDGAGCRLVFVNGRYAAALSSAGSLPAGVVAGSLAEALTAQRPLVEPYLARLADWRQHPFRALNTAFLADGAFVYLPPGRAIEAPIWLVFVSTAPGEPVVAHPRTLVVAGRASQATIVECYLGAGGEVYFTNAVSEVALGDGAVLDYYTVQQESEAAFHIATLEVHQGRSSRFDSHAVALGSALGRQELTVVLGAEGAECSLEGLYAPAGTQHLETRTTIDHAKPHGTSRELYKGILAGRSRGVFAGRIVVRPDAQKTNASQTNKNLILSDEAVADSKPELQIFANDVRCSHGSALGQLDRDALFYLRTRGLPEAAARDLLVRAFAADVLDGLRVAPLRAALEPRLLAKVSDGQGLGRTR